jgi:hypothetical protein
MKATSLAIEIIARGGSAELKHDERGRTGVVGTLNGYDIEMMCGSEDFYTIRKIDKRDYFDAGSDYNPGGYTFCHRIKDLSWTQRVGVAA